MSAQASSSSAPPIPPPANRPSSISPTLPSSASSIHSPSINMTSPSIHSPESARQIAEARAALEASMTNIGSALDITLRSRAQDLHSNSKQLEKQEKDITKATEGLRKEGDKLKKVADEGMRRVKELGNVQNWAEMLERDFLVLGETLRLVERGSESGSYTGSEEGSEWETSSEGSRMDEAGGEHLGALDREGEGSKKEVDRAIGEEPTPGAADRTQFDADTDMQMAGTGTESKDNGKGKAVEILADSMDIEQPITAVGGSSTATTTTGSLSNPSSSSVHTSASVAS